MVISTFFADSGVLMSETGAMPGDSHFIDWDLLGKQILAERRRLLVVAAADGYSRGIRG
jgi:hypothetical protein